MQGGNSTVGTIDATGKYTAPASFPSPDKFMVTASASGATANANLTVAFPNDNHVTQTGAIELGTTGGNSTDSTTTGTPPNQTITCCSGTLGSLVTDGVNLFILSNNHVLNKSDHGATNDPITQPGLVDNNCSPGAVVAHLTKAATLKPTNGTNGPAPSNVDAAIATIVNGSVDPSGNILDLGTAGPNSIAAAPPSSLGLAVPANVLAANEGVAKSGRSTGLTCSNLQSVNTSVSVDYNVSCGGAKAFTSTFANQVVINGGNFSASGDSGSLVVTSDTARPVGLLFAGNTTSTTANPIQDVVNALGPLTFAGTGGDHAVSCDPTATASSASKTVGASAATLSAQEKDRVTTVKEKYASKLLGSPAVSDVNVGASVDNPKEGAVVITVHGATPLPATLDGVRTRVVYANSPVPRAAVADIKRATAIKEVHAQGLMSQSGIQGVGVGVSDDNPAEPTLVIYVIAGMPHPEIPAVMDGLRTKIIEGDRFRAFGWGKETVKPPTCSPKQARALPKSLELPKLP